MEMTFVVWNSKAGNFDRALAVRDALDQRPGTTVADPSDGEEAAELVR